MPEYAMVAHMTLLRSNALHGSRSQRGQVAPDSWHLAEIVRDDVPSPVPICEGPTVKTGTRRPVRDWETVPPQCPECEARAGGAARTQAATAQQAP